REKTRIPRSVRTETRVVNSLSSASSSRSPSYGPPTKQFAMTWPSSPPAGAGPPRQVVPPFYGARRSQTDRGEPADRVRPAGDRRRQLRRGPGCGAGDRAGDADPVRGGKRD